MTARTPLARARHRIWLLAIALPVVCAGCHGMGKKHEINQIPQFGIIDPHQARELQMVSLPPYVVEPPDELEVSVQPTVADFSATSVTVQTDGTIDLGFAGDIYVAGLTLQQIEGKIAEQLNARGGRVNGGRGYQVAVRLPNGTQSKVYYVLGTVNTQGRFPLRGNETVLDGILAAGLRTNSLPEKAYVVRPHPVGGPDLVLKVDWIGIKERGDTLTNYQLFPGDRIVVPGTKPPGLLRTVLGG
jgi:polysaccharide export outer membrane protein